MEAALSIQHCHKRFPGVYALRDVCVEAFPGQVLALLGVNGAGKSTLMNVIGGVIRPDRGSVFIHGQEVGNSSPNVARAHGIAFIQQEVQLFGNLTVYENIFLMNLANYRRIPALPMLDRKRLVADARALLAPLGCDVNPARKVESLSVGEQQMVQIARALSSGGDILLFDEPTSSLSLKEKENLFEVIRKLRADGKTIIYITHYLDEVEIICDQVVVMRDGQVVRKGKVCDLPKAEIIASMVPEKVVFNTEESALGDEVVLRVENLSGERSPKNISFDLHRGEVLGLWGLLGSGRTETVRTLLGLDPMIGGSVSYRQNGQLKPIKPASLFAHCGYVTEGRHHDGLYLDMPLWKNTTSANLRAFSITPFRVLKNGAEKAEGERFIAELKIAAPNSEVLAMQLSGGNQQKVVLSKWLSKSAEILILDEPTRGVDVGAKVEIQNLIRRLAREGLCCIVISSETEEIQKLCDNILVLHNGEAKAYLQGDEINNERLITECLGEGEGQTA